MSNTIKATGHMKAKDVLAEEQASREVSFVYKDVEFTVPPSKTWDLPILRAQERGQVLTTVELLLKDQIVAFEKLVKTAGDLEEFLETMYEAVDTDPKG